MVIVLLNLFAKDNIHTEFNFEFKYWVSTSNMKWNIVCSVGSIVEKVIKRVKDVLQKAVFINISSCWTRFWSQN